MSQNLSFYFRVNSTFFMKLGIKISFSWGYFTPNPKWCRKNIEEIFDRLSLCETQKEGILIDSVLLTPWDSENILEIWCSNFIFQWIFIFFNIENKFLKNFFCFAMNWSQELRRASDFILGCISRSDNQNSDFQNFFPLMISPKNFEKKINKFFLIFFSLNKLFKLKKCKKIENLRF